MQKSGDGAAEVAGDERHQRMSRGDHELDFGMMLEAKLIQTSTDGSSSCQTALRVFVRDVARTGAAQRHGIALSDCRALMFLSLCFVFLLRFPERFEVL